MLTDDWPLILRGLAPGWDSHAAIKISEHAIRTLANFHVVPMNDGGIQLEAHCGGKDLEIEINPAGQICSIFCTNRV
jgi:hypothetical protein